MIPLAPGPGTLDAMNWGWLSGPGAQLIEFVAALITIWLAICWLARRAVPRRPETPAAAAASIPTPAERHARSAFIAPADRDMAEKALGTGWQVKHIGRHHIAWVSPTGARVLAPATPRGGDIWNKDFRASMRRAGLELAS